MVWWYQGDGESLFLWCGLVKLDSVNVRDGEFACIGEIFVGSDNKCSPDT